MPSAAPVPGSPAMMLLGSATGLLDRPGCPACRYVAEAAEGYLARFALDGHHDAGVLTRLCAARGMCPPHTRRLLSQPGAAGRLTAIYRYVVEAAMAGFGRPGARCPACEHDDAAADRVLGVLSDEALGCDRQAYEQHGGLCLPHLRRAAVTGASPNLTWLVRFMIARLDAAPGLDAAAVLAVLAGGPDRDAEARLALRLALPGRPDAGRGRTCQVCWAAADAERGQLAAGIAAGRWLAPRSAADCLCTGHLRDVAVSTDGAAGRAAGRLPAAQARLQAARLAEALDGRARRPGLSIRFRSARARDALAQPDCAVCAGRDSAGRREISRVLDVLRGLPPGAPAAITICLRHAHALYGQDQQAGRLAQATLGGPASELQRELADAFANATWQRRGQPTGPEMTAWRRAAAFLDGAVFGGGPAA
jgi:hypothetical protein